MYHGDIRLGDTIDIKFTSRTFSTGAPGTLSSSPVISAYPGNSVTQLTAGITLSVDFDSVTGLNNVRVVASGGNGYLTATNYVLVITTGTVGGVSVVGECVGSFSIEARSALMPTTAGRTLVVDAAGLADANAVKLGPTGAGTAQTARDVGLSVLLSAGVGTGQLDFTAGVVKANATQWLGGTIPAVNVTGVPLVDLKYTLGTISPAAAGSVRADAVTGAVGSVTGAVGSVTGAVGSVTGNVGGNVTGSVGSVVGAVGSVTGLTAADVGAIKAKTDNLPAAPAAVSDIPTAVQNADALLNRDMSTGTDSGSTTVRTPRQAFRFLRNKWDIAAGVLTVKKEDDSTTSWTGAVSSDAAAVPIIGVDPAG